MIYILLFELMLYLFCSYSFFKNIYGYTPKNNKLIYATPLIYTLFIMINILVDKITYSIIFITVVMLNTCLLKYIFKSAKIRSIICIFILLYSINISISSITVFILNQSSDLILKRIIGLIINFIFISACMIICKIKKDYCRSIFRLTPVSVKRITLLSLISSAFVISLVSDYGAVNDINKWEFSIRITIVLLIITVGSAFPIMIANAIGKSFYIEQAKNFEHQIKIQAEHYESISKSNYELRRFRHDYKNMRIGVIKYIQDGNITKAKQMLLECDDNLKTATDFLIKFDTGNGIVDALLTEKQKKATTANTVITFDGAVSVSAITETDLCVIFGNTLDNAIEACEKLPNDNEKIISITCKTHNGFIFLTITNPVVENVVIGNNAIQTSKLDKLNHGFGLYSLKKTIDKYDGNLDLSCDNYLFKCEISLAK